MHIAQYTSRVGRRAELARRIRTSHLPAAEALGLREADLLVIEQEGEKARKADRTQHEQLAMGSAMRTERAKSAEHLLGDEEGKIRDRMPLVIADLGETPLATFFRRISFARYRIREHATPAPAARAGAEATDEDAVVKSVERVEKQDVRSRLEGLAALCGTIVGPGREAALAAFEARNLSKAEIEQMGKDAQAWVDAGKNTLAAAAATAEEAAAVKAQRVAWAASRRLIKKLCAGDVELARLFAEC